MCKYRVTKEFTGGALKGIVFPGITSVKFKEGEEYPSPVGGSPYKVLKVEILKEDSQFVHIDLKCDQCAANSFCQRMLNITMLVIFNTTIVEGKILRYGEFDYMFRSSDTQWARKRLTYLKYVEFDKDKVNITQTGIEFIKSIV